MPATFPVSYTTASLVWGAAPEIGSISAITSAVLANQYLGPVEAEINAKISKRYALPLGVECPILTAIATREAIFAVMTLRSLKHFPSWKDGKLAIMVQHEADQKLIQAIADGSVQLIDSSMQVVPADLSQAEIYSTTMDRLPTFDRVGPFEDNIIDKAATDDAESNFDIKRGA